MTRFVSGWHAALAVLSACVLTMAWTPTAVGTAAPPGEVWEWALGRNTGTDPDLQQYFVPIEPCTPGDRCPGWAKSLEQGWKANPGADDHVVSVDLFNDETVLGTPSDPNVVSSASVGLSRAFGGTLPLERTWRTTANDMGAVYGAKNMVFGKFEFIGTPPTFEYFSEDGRYKFWFEFYAMTAQALPSALIHKIEVLRGPKY